MFIQVWYGRRPCVEKHQQPKEQNHQNDMSWQSLEGFEWTTWRVFPNSEQNEDVGNDQQDKESHRN